MRLPLILFCAAAMAVAGCGTPGAPRPPSLGIPKPISDLQAVRKGATVTLTWTAPIETTDGELVKKAGKMIVVRAPAQGAGGQPVAEVPLQPALKDLRPEKSTATDSLAGLLQTGAPGDFVFYAVDALSSSTRSAGVSNQVAVPLVGTLPAPRRVTAALVPRGVELSWEAARPQPPVWLNSRFFYRVMRRLEGAADAVKAGEIQPSSDNNLFIDTGIDWEKNYQYWVIPVTLWEVPGTQGKPGNKGEIEGDDSPAVSVFAHDSFPPVVPSGLQAVFSGQVRQPGIDLTWTPNTDEDLAGYNVYRRTDESQPLKINTDLVKTPAFQDAGVQPGMRYTYSVSAVDLRGNESGCSPETSEGVPKE